MKDATQLHIRPARPEEAGLFYTPHPEEDKRLGTVGHVRMDFGRSGNEFWHTWWPRGPEELNSPAFKAELQQVVDTLRESVLKNRFAMERFCYEHGGKISGGWTQNYGYIVETEHYRYCLRCNPSPGDYNCYCTAYDLTVQRQNMARDKPLVGRVTYANGDAQEFTDADEFLRCVQEELPYRPTTGFRYEVLTDDPVVRKQVDDISETGHGREKHGDVTVLFSALSVESGAVRRKGETMNIRKAVDYSTMFATLESVMKADLPQMELYCEIGKAVCAHLEKGAAVAAAEFIKEQYSDMTGFSPRNVRRMRDSWQLYSGTPELLGEALHLNWTQNVVIMEAELPAEERRWYIRQATARNLSKAELLRMIEDSAYLESVLDEKVDVWYNEGNDEISERTQYEEDPVYLSWQYLPQPHGRVRDEGLGKKGGTGIAISYRISGYQSGGDRQPSLSSGTAQAGRAWDLLRRPCRTAVDKSGLRRIRSPDRHGPGQPPGYVPYLRRRLCRQDVPPDGSYRPSRQCGRPMVHRGLRGDLAGCAGWLPRTFERIHDRTR